MLADNSVASGSSLGTLAVLAVVLLVLFMFLASPNTKTEARAVINRVRAYYYGAAPIDPDAAPAADSASSDAGDPTGTQPDPSSTAATEQLSEIERSIARSFMSAYEPPPSPPFQQ